MLFGGRPGVVDANCPITFKDCWYIAHTLLAPEEDDYAMVTIRSQVLHEIHFMTMIKRGN